MTDYTQIYGKYNTDSYKKLVFDLLCINNMSLLRDLELIFTTFFILFSSKSTADVDAGSVTAMGYEND